MSYPNYPSSSSSNAPPPPIPPRKMRTGIMGIERDLEKTARDRQGKISEAFQDINSLIDLAKPMVQLVQRISTDIKDKKGNISDDETTQFRQHLLSLGIKDPVTKAKYGSGNKYFEGLAVEISKLLAIEVKECGGMMSLVEAFCRVNRARGLDLVSPEDLRCACDQMEKLNLPIRLCEIGYKVRVLQHESFDDNHCVATVLSMLDLHHSLTPEEYARLSGIPFLLAKHSLILSENRGKICRDETIEGLRFYSSVPFYDDEDYFNTPN